MKKLRTNVGLAIFVALTSVVVVFLLILSNQRHPLLPAAESRFPYTVIPSTDSNDGGNSQIVLHNAETQWDYSYRLEDGYQYPYTSMNVGFGEALVDWRRYRRLELMVECHPANVMKFTVHTYDNEVTEPDIYLSYRRARTTFSCSPEPQAISIDLKQLDTPKWWLMQFGLPLTHRDYDLSKVFELAVENSDQSPRYTDSRLRITQATLMGRDWRFIAVAALLAAVLCVVIARWLFSWHTKKLRQELSRKMEQESITPNYQPISANCKSDRERNAVLEFMATQYANPELNLEFTTRTLGINRIKVNDILREHKGLTFSAYLKKLRLTEAARLLREKDASVAEIGFMVGYNNAPYFNQMFKKEFGCTPNAYRRTMSQSTTGIAP